MADPQEDSSKGKAPEQEPADNNNNDVPNPAGAEKPTDDKEKPSLKDQLVGKLSSGAQKTIPPQMVDTLLRMNPALANELAGMPKDKAVEVLRNMDVADLLTGMSLGKKNQKDMASYKFWQTQPVPRFDDQGDIAEGPIKVIRPEEVPKEPSALIEGFEWVTLDLNDDKEVAELYDLLSNHYVEDDNAMFRFNYSRAFLNWALTSPGWKKEWHVGVRASKSGKLVASICGVPTDIRVRDQKMKVVEINFLCVHKKLRSKRLAPVLIKEITRRSYLQGIYQAIYTVGIVLPKPVTSCRYYHRPLDWLKLYEVGFSPLPAGSTKARQITRNHLPNSTATPGLRQMKEKDLGAVFDLLERYLGRFNINPAFTKEEIDHWLLHRAERGEQVVWSYVVEDPHTKKITDFVSFYSLESSVINNPKHKEVRAAYLYYYATESAFTEKEKGLKERLHLLINDALIEAKNARFDVFNALTLQDNPLFLEQLKFGAGDGQLHYYLFNYRTAPVPGGVNDKNLPDVKKRGGMGVVLL
ncbi:peptide N-myristoyl transferase [Talaromyces proteolyticus]|uniref:Glycylpeptide N-tetradecanoyltransferase n=1 Tax=Talaromyces proteolyticus TaxID=1131652 RepID=A0AAD4KL87_9EURO|nr:peptide N-myristoyl transferase [Talaromyces proteolyticus]KAH8693726.1 peptide N-myristoyl transferase [Talaromyces proteolyticus]